MAQTNGKRRKGKPETAGRRTQPSPPPTKAPRGANKAQAIEPNGMALAFAQSRIGLFADAKLAKDFSQQIVGGELARDLAQ